MACRLFGTKLLIKPIMTRIQLNPYKNSGNLMKKSDTKYTKFSVTAFENVICKKYAIFSGLNRLMKVIISLLLPLRCIRLYGVLALSSIQQRHLLKRTKKNHDASCLWGVLNPLHAKFFRGNINIYLHFMSFLRTNKTQIVEVPPRIREGPVYST